MSNVINGAMPPEILPLDATQAGAETTDTGGSHRSVQHNTPEQPAALSQFSGAAEILSSAVNSLKTQSPPVRSSVVAALKQSVASGSYSPDLEAVAGAVTKALTNG